MSYQSFEPINDTSASASPAAVAAPAKKNNVPGWLQALIHGGGMGLGGVAGGGLGTLLGLETGPGAIATGVAGSAIGAGLGNYGAEALINSINKMTGGDAPATLGQAYADDAKAGAAGSAYDLAGQGVGYLAHPIANIAEGWLKPVLAKSGVNVDVGKTLADFNSKVMPKYREQGVGSFADEAAQRLLPDVRAAIAERQLPYLKFAQNPAPGVAAPVNDISAQMLPAIDANGLKQDLYRNTNYQKGMGPNPNVPMLLNDAQKRFAGLLRNDIHNAVPAAVLPDQIMSKMYQIPDVLQSLAQMIPGGKAVAKIGGAAENKLVQPGLTALSKLLKFAPAAGAWWNGSNN